MNRWASAALSTLAFACLAAAANAEGAEDYPSHPIKLILPQPPGGAVDLVARTLGEPLSD
jgi:tripartite-type tricarboxylate transporter receptor subunit TctC